MPVRGHQKCSLSGIFNDIALGQFSWKPELQIPFCSLGPSGNNQTKEHQPPPLLT
jgi:hypothetical protein